MKDEEEHNAALKKCDYYHSQILALDELRTLFSDKGILEISDFEKFYEKKRTVWDEAITELCNIE